MLKPKTLKPVLVQCTLKRLYALRGVFVAALILSIPLFINTGHTAAAASSYLNFQARLENANGAIAPDGLYNVEFKLYDSAGAGASGQGSCSGDSSTDDCWWMETRTGANQVRVANGYLTVNLGSVIPFSANIPWDQQLYLSMNIGGTGGTPSWDGEMTPRLALTSVPYAFQAENATKLQVSNGANLSTLTLQAPTGGSQIFQVPDQGAAGTYDLLTQNSGDGRYIQLQTTTPGTAQTGNFNISGTGIASYLGVNTISPSDRLTVDGNILVRDADAPSRAYRIRTNGGGVDMESGGSPLFISTWSNTDFSGTQYVKLVLDASNVSQAIGSWQFRTAADATIRHTIDGSSGANVIFNQDSEATNFTVQGSTDSSLLFVQGSTERVGIGVALPNYKLDVNGVINSSTSLQAPLLDTATAVPLNIGTTNATAINLNQNVNVAGELRVDETVRVNNGSDIVMTADATTPTDPGDLVFRDNSNAEYGRVRAGNNELWLSGSSDTSTDLVVGEGYVNTGGTLTVGSASCNLAATSGQLCVNQAFITSGTSLNTNVTANTSSAASIWGNAVGLQDNSAGIVNTDYGYYFDGSSSTNASAVINSFYSKVASGQDGNFLQFQSGANTVLTVSNAGAINADGPLTLGGASTAANFVLNDGTGKTITITPSAQSQNVTLTIPDAAAATDILCLQNVGNCAPGLSTTLQDVYNNSGATPIITVTTAGGGVLIRDNSPSIGGGNLFAVQDNVGSASYLAVTTGGVSVTGVLGASTSVQTPLLDTASAVALNIGTNNATAINLKKNTTIQGTATVQTTGNSSTSFQILQDTTGAKLFVADTSAMRVYIGDPTADANATLLVLDTKNTSGDPTGVNGAMYYNSNLGEFRCYQNGTWTNCIPQRSTDLTLFAHGSSKDCTPAAAETLGECGGAGASKNLLKMDLSGYTQARVKASYSSGSYGYLRLQYSTDFSNWYYLDGSSGPSLDLSSGNGSDEASPWVNITPAAQGDVWIRGWLAPDSSGIYFHYFTNADAEFR